MAYPLTGHGKITPHLLVLHWFTVPYLGDLDTYDPRAYNRETIMAKMEDLAERESRKAWGGYNAVWFPEGPALVTPPGQRAYHAGGSEGLDNPNSNAFGLGVPYISASTRSRGIAGEIEAPLYLPSKGREVPGFYPPLDAAMLVESVDWAREHFIAMGWDRLGVLTHAQINARKNDIRHPLMPKGASVAELSARFQA
jgi:hypothetical protein